MVSGTIGYCLVIGRVPRVDIGNEILTPKVRNSEGPSFGVASFGVVRPMAIEGWLRVEI